MAAETAPREIHLLVIIHGLWGSVSHISSIVKTIQAAYEDRADSLTHELRVLCPKTNESDNTYDGVDFCSVRVLQEIDEFIQDAHDAQQAVTRFSIVGYSLGGCIARCLIGALEARSPSFFDSVEPVNFTTFASPAVGVPHFPNYLSRLINWFGPRVLSRSGAQLYATDDFLNGRPLLEVMSQPGTSFHKALLRFQKKQIYANAVHDRTVPWSTGYFPENYIDPFARADRIARMHVDDPDALSVDLRLGGLQLTFKKECPHIIEKVESIKPPIASENKTKRWRWPSLPFFLKPSTFSSLPYGLGYVVPVLMPLLIPSFILYILARFMIQSHKSQRRIRSLHTGELSTMEGRLRRVGLALEDTFEEIAEDVFPLSGSDSEELTETDPIFTPSQKRMIQNLNAIPDLEKIMVYLPQERNSHGAIICRNPSFEGHRKGLEVLKWWSDKFIF